MADESEKMPCPVPDPVAVLQQIADNLGNIYKALQGINDKLTALVNKMPGP
jgi:hypothetical protein